MACASCLVNFSSIILSYTPITIQLVPLYQTRALSDPPPETVDPTVGDDESSTVAKFKAVKVGLNFCKA